MMPWGLIGNHVAHVRLAALEATMEDFANAIRPDLMKTALDASAVQFSSVFKI